jgi:ABC-type lipoprotein release transport system permease subunit
MLSTTTGSAGILIYGVIPDLENKASQLHQKIIEGKDFNQTRKNEVMIGKKLAQKMKLKLGSRLVLTFIDTANIMVAGAFKVAAIYQSNNAPLDEKNVYVNSKDLNALLGIQQGFHEVVVLLYREEDLEKVKSKLQEKFPVYQIETWREISPETDLLVKTVDQYSYIIMVIILFALAFGILNTMLMAVLERTREIGMMVALGTNRIKIFSLICLETVFLTLAGTPIGIFMAWLVTSYFHRNGLNLSGMGKEMMSSFGFSALIYPEFPTEKLVGILVIVITTAIFSCLFPAMKALKLQAVEALRR